MGQSERRLSNFLVVCVVAFFAGCLLVVLSMFPGLRFFMDPTAMIATGASLMIIAVAIGIVGFLMAVAVRKQSVAKSRTGPRKRIEVKIYSVWRTDKGKIVDPFETELEKPGYHAVLMTPEGKRFEVETDATIFAQCVEGSWGYAEVQGDWMGSYVRDGALYSKYTGR